MKHALLAAACLMACAACGGSPDETAGEDVIGSEALPAAVEAPTPDFTGIPDWRPVNPADLLLLEVEDGVIAIELADWIAPNHANRMRQAARDGFFDGRSFYRVIDGFVAQGGRGEDPDAVELPQYPPLSGEFTIPASTVTFSPMSDADLYAPTVGHVDGFPAAMNEAGNEVWPIHCPGTVAMARDNDPDSGDVEFYIVIGQGPRHLDRIMSVFGRVIDGMEHVQALQRGDPAVNSGVIADTLARDIIVSARIASDLPEADRPAYEVMRTDGQAFWDAKQARRNRTHDFFFETPPPVIEACHMPGPVRIVEPQLDD
ncbi:peptidylprolyl isomerase [Maricaulis sp. W15]|uniref:peptidylprolyl isomerase n=1 Tax=Maricaulis sp. W15 TaxID=1772333 RepID=UPI0009488B81|nr:peptidylprolyl isomerase [Maricaulis sp. W15]OLF78237.1 peptidylprolyl isomerase [Maricaulis sp. W15]